MLKEEKHKNTYKINDRIFESYRYTLSKYLHRFSNKIYGGYDIVAPTMHNDIKMFINFNDGIDKSIYNGGFYDKGLTNYILKNITVDDVCVDVGANIGWISCLLGVKSKKVYSFEPNSVVFDRLVCNIYLNNLSNKIIFNDKAVGNSNDEQSFVSYEHSGHGHLGVDVRSKKTLTGISKVEVVRLDDYLKDIKSLDFLKIDVEGFEFEVIKGSSYLIEKFKPLIVFEYNNQKSCLDFLSGLGYNFFLLDNMGELLIIDRELKGNDNVVCKPV